MTVLSYRYWDQLEFIFFVTTIEPRKPKDCVLRSIRVCTVFRMLTSADLFERISENRFLTQNVSFLKNVGATLSF